MQRNRLIHSTQTYSWTNDSDGTIDKPISHAHYSPPFSVHWNPISGQRIPNLLPFSPVTVCSMIQRRPEASIRNIRGPQRQNNHMPSALK